MAEWRYIAQRALTGEFLDFDLPLSRDELTFALSGPGSLRGTVAPDVGGMRDAEGRLILEEWGTFIYAEADGRIRWGGIVVSSEFSGDTWAIEAAGFTTYPYGIPYLGNYSTTSADPADVLRMLWQYVQAQPNGNLDVRVDDINTPARVGSAEQPYALTWWEAPDVGSEIENLLREGRIDYTETHAWSGDTISHRVTLHYPRAGTRRNDLAFIQGDNIVDSVVVTRNGDDFANEIFAVGAGEGALALRKSIPAPDGRLRRPAVYTDKGITAASRLDLLARGELARRRGLLDIQTITVADHPHAPLASWSLGDDILVQVDVPWLGPVALWCRVVAWSLVGDSVANLTLKRADSFTYGA